MTELENLIYTALWKVNSGRRLNNTHLTAISTKLAEDLRSVFDKYQGNATTLEKEQIIESAEKTFNAVLDRRTGHWCPPVCKS
jgi:hypothetical protein